MLFRSLSIGLTVAAGATLVAAVAAWFLIAPKPPAPTAHRVEEPEAEAIAEPVAA